MSEEMACLEVKQGVKVDYVMLSQFQERNSEKGKEGTTGTRGVLCSDLSQTVSWSKIGATWTAFLEYFVMTLMHFTSVPLQT